MRKRTGVPRLILWTVLVALAAARDGRADTLAVPKDGGTDESSQESDASPSKRRAPSASSDRACPWGRLANGRGVLVRCLTAEESRALTAGLNSDRSRRSADVRAAETEVTSPVEAEVGVVVFEGERLPSAASALSPLRASYKSCVVRNGGLKRPSGEVRVRFRVDAHGLTRQTSVSRRRALAPRAAQCVAQAVERRFVGVPSGGASIGTVVIRFTRVGSN